MKFSRFATIAVCAGILMIAGEAHAQVSTAFTYQGLLMNGSTPVTTAVDIRCTLFDSAGGANQVGSPITILNVTPVDGRFTIPLDFGQLANANRWLQIETRPAGSGGYTALTPRQQLTASPYANFASRSGSADQLNGQIPSFYTNASNLTSGTIPDARLSTNVPQLSLNSAWTGLPSFNGGVSGSTPPFNVDSTFRVTNLNADLLDGMDSAAFATSGHNHAHSGLTGLGNDDHPQYYNQARGDARYATLNGTPTFATVTLNSTIQTPFSVTSTFTGGTWTNLTNTSAGGHQWNLISTGSSNTEGAGKFMVRDATANTVRMTVDTSGRVGIGTSSPGAPLDVVVAANQSLQFRLDSFVPGINVNNSGGNAGILRLRNAMEVWPSDDSTRAGKIDVRNTGGNATITLDGASGNVSANNQTAVRSSIVQRSARTSVFPGDWATCGQGGFIVLRDLSVTVPATGTLMLFATANVASYGNSLYLKITDTQGELIEVQSRLNSGSFHSETMQITWAVPIAAAGQRVYQLQLTNSSSSNDAYVGTVTFHALYVPGTLNP